MCADVAIHDTDGHNPHAHIMLTVCPLNENGTWQHKTEKEYLCVKDGEERGFTAAEFKEAQKDGWEKRIDHRSFADQGKDEQPTIHEGVATRTMEKKSILSDRCEINRQIKRDNALLRQLKAEVQMLVKTVQNSLTAIAQAMEKLRANMIVFAYQVVHINSFIMKTRADMEDIVSGVKQYDIVTGQIKQKLAERKELLTEKKALSPLQFSENRRLNVKIAEATEDLEELKSEKEQIMSTFGKADDNGMKDVKSWIDRREKQIQKAADAEAKYSAELDKALDEYHELEVRAESLDLTELETARLSLRPEEERRAVTKVENAYGNSYDYATMHKAKDRVSNLLGENPVADKSRSVRRDLHQAQEWVREQKKHRERLSGKEKENTWEQ